MWSNIDDVPTTVDEVNLDKRYQWIPDAGSPVAACWHTSLSIRSRTILPHGPIKHLRTTTDVLFLASSHPRHVLFSVSPCAVIKLNIRAKTGANWSPDRVIPVPYYFIPGKCRLGGWQGAGRVAFSQWAELLTRFAPCGGPKKNGAPTKIRNLTPGPVPPALD